jgi:ADP-heptose:LPS heptosyltransferase
MTTITLTTRSRFINQTEVVARALAARAKRPRTHPVKIRRVLLAHHLLLGDTLMLTPLMAKLRARYPEAEIAMTIPRAIAPLYSTHPYGVRALPWDPRHANEALFTESRFDLAFVAGDNRYAWLAAAMHSRWIVAFAGDPNERKNWPIDELRRYPDRPAAWGDMVATLLDGPAPQPFVSADWKAPAAKPYDAPPQPYAVLHVGASTPLKLWPADRWAALADWLVAQGITPVWSAGRGEEEIIDVCDPERRFVSFAGRMDLPQLWHLFANARLVVAPDTGAAHLARVAGAPTVALFGPGSAIVTGAGDFWRNSPYRAVTVDPFPCRDQRVLFRREIEWVRRCARTPAQCPEPLCMQAISLDAVIAAAKELGILAR